MLDHVGMVSVNINAVWPFLERVDEVFAPKKNGMGDKGANLNLSGHE